MAHVTQSQQLRKPPLLVELLLENLEAACCVSSTTTTPLLSILILLYHRLRTKKSPLACRYRHNGCVRQGSQRQDSVEPDGGLHLLDSYVMIFSPVLWIIRHPLESIVEVQAS